MTLQTDEKLAAEVRGLVAKRQIRYPEIAAALDISKMAVSRRLTAQTSFTAEELRAMADLLGVPIASLFGTDPESPAISALTYAEMAGDSSVERGAA